MVPNMDPDFSATLPVTNLRDGGRGNWCGKLGRLRLRVRPVQLAHRLRDHGHPLPAAGIFRSLVVLTGTLSGY